MNLIAERKMDELGRIVLPLETRNKLQLTADTVLQIFEDGDKIILQKSIPSCKVCGSINNIHPELTVCRECIEKIKNYNK